MSLVEGNNHTVTQRLEVKVISEPMGQRSTLKVSRLVRGWRSNHRLSHWLKVRSFSESHFGGVSQMVSQKADDRSICSK